MHDTMYLNKMSRTSSKKIGPIVYLTMGMAYLLSLFAPNPSGGFAAKKLFLGRFHTNKIVCFVPKQGIYLLQCIFFLVRFTFTRQPFNAYQNAYHQDD